MISKRLRGSLDSSICIRDIFEEGKKTGCDLRLGEYI